MCPKTRRFSNVPDRPWYLEPDVSVEEDRSEYSSGPGGCAVCTTDIVTGNHYWLRHQNELPTSEITDETEAGYPWPFVHIRDKHYIKSHLLTRDLANNLIFVGSPLRSGSASTLTYWPVVFLINLPSRVKQEEVLYIWNIA